MLDIPTTGTPGVGLSGTSGVTAGIPTVDSGIPGSIGLPGVAGVTGLAGAAGLAAWALRDRTSRLTIAPGRNQTLESYWTVTDADQRAAREQGGRDFQMRVYDVTDIDFNTQSAHSMQFYDLDVLDRQGQVAIPDPNRDYLAEVGYVSETGTWLPLARSNSIRASVQESISVPPTPPAEIEAEGTGVGATTVALVGGSGIAAGGTLVGSALDAGLVGATTEAPLLTHDLAGEDCWMTLRTQGEQSVSARWHLPQSQRENARQQGGQQLQLRVYDIDHVDVDIQAPNSVQVYDCDEFNDDVDQEWQVPVPHRDHYYIAEIGYNTLEQEWMPLARSNSVRVPELSSTTAGSSKIAQSAMVGAGAVMAATAPLGRLGVSNQSRVTIMPQSGSEAMVASWQIATNEQATAQQQGGQQFQLRIHDVTGVDPETQPAHSIHVYDCDRAMGELQVSAPVSDRDYVAEVGYLTPDQRWIQLAYSQSMRIPPTAESTTPVALGGVGLGMVGVATGVATATAAIPDAWSEGSSPGVAIRPDIPDQGTSRDGCKIEHLTVSSQNNCYILNPDQVRNLQETAISKTLEPGIYLIRIKAGNFGYTSGQGYTGEPVVLVWINGGRVMNQKTNMPVPATWSSLNGYSETLTLKVLETTTLYTFFIDTYREDNSGEITLSVARLYPNN
ncbi:MAG: DUF4912 domain-containing protein [Oscillatoriales cyanobacterium SM2_3_0]|nr:DUF4912 domain-containing protein [Oscillatoriales cyanobacterium SM2_3_0]